MIWFARSLLFGLALLIAFAGQQIAVARGQAVLMPQMVLCVGGTTVSLPMGPEGAPAGAGHICPDGVLTLAVVPEAVAPMPAAQRLIAAVAHRAAAEPLPAAPRTGAFARGPPVAV